jgi:hypothetical protein
MHLPALSPSLPHITPNLNCSRRPGGHRPFPEPRPKFFLVIPHLIKPFQNLNYFPMVILSAAQNLIFSAS